MKPIYSLLLIFFLAACGNDPDKDDSSTVETIPPPVQISYSLLKVYPHDTSAYTQGLQFVNGFLYEGTGNPDSVPNKSKLRKVDYASGKILKETSLPGILFGEGITVLGDKIYQLTWTNKKGFVYNLSDFKLIKEFSYDIEGWGLTNDGKNLIVTDGSNNIYFWDPETLKEIKRISVQDNSGMKNNLNESEYINGYIFVNVYTTNEILKVDPINGNVIGRIDFSELKKTYPELQEPPTDYLNGIAWDSSGNRLFITGKYWSKMFEIRLN